MKVLVVAVVLTVQVPVGYLQWKSDAELFVDRRADFSAESFYDYYWHI